ncbi:MAG: D-glycero-beta-D-manno-heptose 1-phosphate adenylyltransferase [Bacteroidota bacterium]
MNNTDLDNLLTQLDKHRKQDETIVFTNGCFDILHRGHVTYLQAARNLGDLLVIGVNTDASVKRLKGEGRPINNEDDRAFILQSLACVDYVIKFGEDTPHELLSQIRPDILVKGGDYKLEEVVGREFAQQVVLIDFVDGYSTTKTIQKMKEIEN